MGVGEHGPHGLLVETIARRPESEAVIILFQSMEDGIVWEIEQLALHALGGTVEVSSDFNLNFHHMKSDVFSQWRLGSMDLMVYLWRQLSEDKIEKL